MVRTRVGYAGGSKLNPTYYDLGDHTEVFQVDYDPRVITYREIMDVFWGSHNPCARAYSRQYMTAVFYHDDEQRALAEEFAAKVDGKLQTSVLPLDRFYRAEDYHQKYWLRQSPRLEKEMLAYYPEVDAFTDSTAVMRLNAYVGGEGDRQSLAKEIDQFGLSSETRAALLDAIPERSTTKAR